MEVVELLSALVVGLDSHPGLVAAVGAVGTWLELRRTVGVLAVKVAALERRLDKLEDAPPSAEGAHA